MTCTNQTVVSAHPWTHWEKLTFDQSFISKHQNFSYENCHLDNKRRSKIVGTFRKYLEWGAETFSDWSKTHTTYNMVVIDTNQGVSMEKVWLFNVAPNDGIHFGHLLISISLSSSSKSSLVEQILYALVKIERRVLRFQLLSANES